MISGRQIRAARGLLGISATDLARRSRVGWATIQRIENEDGVPSSRASTILKIKAALEDAGVQFIGDPKASPGVRFQTEA